MFHRKRTPDRSETEDTGTFTISIYGGESGELIREYAMEEEADKVTSVEDAERAACSKLASSSFGEVVVVITKETVAAFNQIQIRVPA